MSDNFITLEQAQEYIQRYRSNLPNMLTPDYDGALVFSETFDASAIQTLLDQPGCVGFKVYYGMKADKKVCSIFVGVNENGEDMMGLLKGGGGDIIVENGRPCPPLC